MKRKNQISAKISKQNNHKKDKIMLNNIITKIKKLLWNYYKKTIPRLKKIGKLDKKNYEKINCTMKNLGKNRLKKLWKNNPEMKKLCW